MSHDYCYSNMYSWLFMCVFMTDIQITKDGKALLATVEDMMLPVSQSQRISVGFMLTDSSKTTAGEWVMRGPLPERGPLPDGFCTLHDEASSGTCIRTQGDFSDPSAGPNPTWRSLYDMSIMIDTIWREAAALRCLDYARQHAYDMCMFV